MPEHTPIAIVGMSCLLPGARTPEEFWASLLDGSDHRTHGGREVFGTDATVPGGWGDDSHWIAATRGGFVAEGDIDLSGLAVPAEDLAGLGKVVRWPLHTSRLALADAGVSPSGAPARTGLVLGNYSFPTEESVDLVVPALRRQVADGLRRCGLALRDDAPEASGDPRTLWAAGLPTNTITTALGLDGPHLALDAACSSALYSMSVARDYLATGAADLMLAGAVCAPDPLLIHLSFSDLRALAADTGVSQPFDARSSGIVTGQGAGVVVLKRLDDAVRDGDRVHAVVESIGLTNDGPGRHLLVPNVSGQLQAYRNAYETVDPSTVDYIECHATGTPLGDSTELRGLREFFGGLDSAPLLGSVKGNVGHLLTVAGFTSLLKVVLAMRHGSIPPTPGVDEPLTLDAGEDCGDAVVRTERDWPGGGPRRAGVSAFGFGGTNAHAVLSSGEDVSAGAPTAPPANAPRLAITGVGAMLGALDSAARVHTAVRDACGALRRRPTCRWYGADDAEHPPADPGDAGYAGELDFDLSTYRIPPVELNQANPQHLMMFDAADEALSDAGYVPVAKADGQTDGQADERRVAVVIAMEMEPHTHTHRARFDIGAYVRDECARAGIELAEERMAELEAVVRDAVHEPIGANEVLSYIGNIMASRISAAWGFTGPAFTVSSDGSGGARAIEVASLLLRDPSLEAVLVGGVELACGVDNVAAHARLAAESGSESPPPGDGAAAVVLTHTATAERTYGTIESVELRRTAADAANSALSASGTEQSEVDYLELGSTRAAELDGEIAALSGTYSGTEHSCAVGALGPLVGDTQQCSAIAALVKVALCLHHAELPATPSELNPESADDTSFYRVDYPRPWLLRSSGGNRVAAISATGGVTAAHLVITGRRTAAAERAVDWTGGPGALLLPLVADDPAGLAEQARLRHAELDRGCDALALCRQGAAAVRQGGLTAVLIASESEALRGELSSAQRDLPAALENSGEWFTPAGSYCTARPIGADAPIAFVFPGAFTGYPGAASDLFRLFPGLLPAFEEECDHPEAQFKHRELYPRTRGGADRRFLLHHEAALLDDIPVMLAAGTNIAVLRTRLLRDLLGVRPHGAFGYSLGESSMLFAMGAWRPGARNDSSLAATPLFREEARGPKQLVRDAWNVPADVPDAEVWATHVLLAAPEAVRAELSESDRVFITHVNAPGEVVVGGDPQQCRELIGRLGCQAAKAPVNHVIHVPLLHSRLQELAALNDYPLQSRDGDLQLLSAYDYAAVGALGRSEVAERIAWTLCSTIDFAELARTAHDRGFRYFVEVGPGATCTRWIGETLHDREHLAVSVDRRGVSEGVALARALARLVSHGVRADLGALLGQPDAPENGRVTHRVTCGGPSVVDRVQRASEPLLTGGSAAPPPPDTSGAGAADAPREPDGAAVVTPGAAAAPDAGTTAGRTPDPGAAVTPSSNAGPQQPTCPPDRRTVPEAAPARPREAALEAGPAAVLGREVLHAHRSALRAQLALQQRAVAELAASCDDELAASCDDELAASCDDRARERPTGVVWDSDDLLEFARGQVSAVFGAEYAEIDEYPVRVRLPEPPYLFVSRVTELSAQVGCFEPSSITTEYDIPSGAWYTVDGLTPCAVTIEAGQCDLLLVSYLGIDFHNRGERVYRLLDSTLVFHGDLPREGQTLRYEITVDSFVSNGDNLLFFFNYRCYADGVLILELLEATAGFFSSGELDSSAGVVETEADRRRRRALQPSWFKPLARTGRTALSAADLAALAEGRHGDVFGPQWDQSADGCNTSLRLPTEMLRMVDEVPRIDRLGGPCCLGDLSAAKHLRPDGWYFRCHFPGDPVLAGSLVAEGGVQVLQTYALYLGLHLVLPDGEFQSVPGLQTEVKVRGQITPSTPRIDYHVEVTRITLLPRPTVVADITVYDGCEPIVAMRDFGIQIREKPGTAYRPEQGGVPSFLGRRNDKGEAAVINELHLAHAAKGDLATAMGPEFEIYRDRRAPYIPNGDFRFVDRIMRFDGVRGRLEAGSVLVTEYDSPPEAWYHAGGVPGMPNCVYMETSLQAAILLGYYLGATLEHPDTEFSIRNLDGCGRLLSSPDLRGRTVRHETTLLSSSTGAGAILQRFRYELSVDGEAFYTGESLFGYFTEEALADQVGLDGGELSAPWLDRQAAHSVSEVEHVPVRQDDRLFAGERGPRLSDGHLRLVDEATVLAEGGKCGLGYVRARSEVSPDDWYFDCHFHQDPVMPGSLGVEAIIQALQVWVLRTGVADAFADAEFAVAQDVALEWKYRGQILHEDGEMVLDAHVTEIRRDADRVTVVADANVWKQDLRIYELTSVAVEVRDTSQRGA